MKNDNPYLKGATQIENMDNELSKNIRARQGGNPYLEGAIPIEQDKTRESLKNEFSNKPKRVKGYGEYIKTENPGLLDLLGYTLQEKAMRPAAEYLQEHPTLNKYAQKAANLGEEYVNKPMESWGIPDIASGFLDTYTNSAPSAFNLASTISDKVTGDETPRIPHFNFDEYHSRNPYAGLLHKVGNVPGALAGGRGVYQALEHAVPRVTGWMGLLGDALKGGIGGYTTGENKEGGGREFSALLGSALGFLSNLTRGGASRNVMGEVNRRGQHYHEGFEDVFNQAANSGIRRVQPPRNIDRAELNRLPRDRRLAVDEFFEHGGNTPRGAQRARSELVRESMRLEDIQRKRGMNSGEERRMQAINDAQEAIDEALNRRFITAGRPDLAEGITNLREGYRQEVGPFLHNPSIENFRMGNRTESDFLKELGKNKTFQAQSGHLFPEIGLSNLLHSPLVAGGIAAGGVGAGAYQLLTNLLREERR